MSKYIPPDSMSHQDLLELAVEGWLGVICEFSGSIREDCCGLREWSHRYAAAHGLNPPKTDWSLYIMDEVEWDT